MKGEQQEKRGLSLSQRALLFGQIQNHRFMMLMHFPATIGVIPTLVKCFFLIVFCSGMELEGEVKKLCLSLRHVMLLRQCSTLPMARSSCTPAFSFVGGGVEGEDRGPCCSGLFLTRECVHTVQ